MVILWRVSQEQVADNRVLESVDANQDWSESVYICSIQVIPGLPVAVQRSTTINVDIVSPEFEAGRHILEYEFEGVGLPVCRIVGEEPIVLGYLRIGSVRTSQLRQEFVTQINVIEESPIHGRRDVICNTLLENRMATIVALMKRRQNERSIISGIIIVGVHITDLGSRWR